MSGLRNMRAIFQSQLTFSFQRSGLNRCFFFGASFRCDGETAMRWITVICLPATLTSSPYIITHPVRILRSSFIFTPRQISIVSEFRFFLSCILGASNRLCALPPDISSPSSPTIIRIVYISTAIYYIRQHLTGEMGGQELDGVLVSCLLACLFYFLFLFPICLFPSVFYTWFYFSGGIPDGVFDFGERE